MARTSFRKPADQQNFGKSQTTSKKGPKSAAKTGGGKKGGKGRKSATERKRGFSL